MRRLIVALVCVGLLAGTALADEPVGGILVSPAWVADHLADPSLVILHASWLRQDYTRAHIPGARFVWPEWLAPTTPDGSFDLAPVETLDNMLEALGVSDSSRIVICHVLGDAYTAARVYVTLDYLGMGGRTFILDGGMEAWQAEGRPVTSEVPVVTRGVFTPHVNPDIIVDRDYVKAHLQDTVVRLVDARSARAFNAAPSATIYRGGHIPGALNLPATAVTDSTGKYRPVDSLQAAFTGAGIAPGVEIVAYCGIGRSACPVYVAAKILGYRVRMYDGSFEEWSRHDELPVEMKTGK
jgi:thiosulfate/3-mercaptopyruvate sulfurtransferase